MVRRHALRGGQWERIKDLLTEREGRVEVTAKDSRVVDSLLRAGKAARQRMLASGSGVTRSITSPGSPP